MEDSLLQPGLRQVAAGYVLYGSSTVMVLTIGTGVDMFVLDHAIGAFVRVAEGMKIPPKNKCYSLNEGNRLTLPEGYQRYLHWAQENGYSSRYVGAMVADVHRILIQGGVFMYPPTKKAPKGKLRLMYEANPMAFIVEQAGGKALAAPGAAHPGGAADGDPPAHLRGPRQQRGSGRRGGDALKRPAGGASGPIGPVPGLNVDSGRPGAWPIGYLVAINSHYVPRWPPRPSKQPCRFHSSLRIAQGGAGACAQRA